MLQAKGSPMKRRNLAGVFIAGVAAVIALCPPGAADPTVQQLQPSLPSTPARDEQFLAELARAGIRVTDVPTAVFGAHDTCAYLAAGHDALEAAEQGERNNATMTRTDEIAYIDAAIETYCPRYVKMTGTLS
jgi:hypothetical protein